MKLSELEANEKLDKLIPAADDICSMYRSAERFLNDARNDQNSSETRLDLAYHSVFAIANMALRATVFKLKGVVDSHLLTLNTLQYTVGIDKDRVQYFHALRIKRHRDFYTGRLVVSSHEREEAIKHAEMLLVETSEWLRTNFPKYYDVMVGNVSNLE